MPVICSLSRCLFSTLWWLIPPGGLSSVQPMAALAHAGKRHFTTCLPSPSSSSYHSSSWSPATAGYCLRSPRKWQKTAVSFFDKNISNGNFLISLQVTWPCSVFALTLLHVICHANVLLLLWSLSHLVLSNKVQLRRSKNNIPRARMRTLKMTVVIVLSFMVCWTPYYMLGLWYWFCPAGLEETVSQSLSHILFIFGLLNACLDPIIYGLFTIPLCMRHRQCEHNIVAFELENTNNSLMTSIRTSTSSLTLKRLTVQQTSREKLEWDGEYVHRIGDDGAKNGVAFASHSTCTE